MGKKWSEFSIINFVVDSKEFHFKTLIIESILPGHGKIPGHQKPTFIIFFPLADCPGKPGHFPTFFFYNSVGGCNRPVNLLSLGRKSEHSDGDEHSGEHVTDVEVSRPSHCSRVNLSIC